MVPKPIIFLSSIIPLVIIFFRPMLLGDLFTVVGMGLMMVSCVVALLIQKSYKVNLRKHDRTLYGLVLLLWVYLLASGVANVDANVEFLLKAFAACVLVILSSICFIRLNGFYTTFEKVVVLGLALLGFLGVLSYVATLYLGIGSTLIYELQVADSYHRPARIVLPFGVIYQDFNTGSVVVWRLQSVFREAGIAQCFYLWGLSLAIVRGHRWWVVFGCFLGVVTCFSTIGAACLCLTASYFIFLRSERIHISLRLFASIFLPIVGFAALYYTPGIGIVHKINTHQVAIDYRTEAIFNADYSSIFTGSGLYSVEFGGGNLLGLVPEIGILGLLLVILCYGYALMMPTQGISFSDKLVVLGPIMLTGLVAQPFLDGPAIWFFILVTCAGRKLELRSLSSQPARASPLVAQR